MSTKVSPLAPATFPDLPAIAGVRLASVEAGIRYRGRTDVLLALLDEGTVAAGVFTRSRCPSAPVEWCRGIVKAGRARALVVNSGNANAFTGARGREATEQTARLAARVAGCAPDEVFLASTGVIGEPLDAGRFEGALDTAASAARPDAWSEAARAIMTTDTFPKLASRHVEIDGTTITLNAIAKGSGMIEPDMATMLSFVFTDAAIAPEALQAALRAAVAGSFNAISVDGDTSTSDTVLAFATGGARAGVGPRIESLEEDAGTVFAAALADLCRELAHLVVRDGEGASKFVTVEVRGAENAMSARRIAKSIANSPLIKTAIAGEDANWGRVVMAVGKAGEPAERDRLAIWFGDTRVAFEGERDPGYDEAAVSAYMKGEEITIAVDLGIGQGEDTVWTCDLTHDYIAINADYRS